MRDVIRGNHLLSFRIDIELLNLRYGPYILPRRLQLSKNISKLLLIHMILPPIKFVFAPIRAILAVPLLLIIGIFEIKVVIFLFVWWFVSKQLIVKLVYQFFFLRNSLLSVTLICETLGEWAVQFIHNQVILQVLVQRIAHVCLKLLPHLPWEVWTTAFDARRCLFAFVFEVVIALASKTRRQRCLWLIHSDSEMCAFVMSLIVLLARPKRRIWGLDNLVYREMVLLYVFLFLNHVVPLSEVLNLSLQLGFLLHLCFQLFPGLFSSWIVARCFVRIINEMIYILRIRFLW